MARELEPLVKKLSKEGKHVYSISKLDCKEQCDFQYYLTYVLGNRGLDSCYSIMGGKMHDKIEEFYHGKANNDDLYAALTDTLADMDMLNINFPSENVKNNWKADMVHFCNNFSVKKGKYKTEQGYIIELFPDIFMQGYIDLEEDVGNDEVDIIDFKTSSKFSAQDLDHKGMQLVAYKLMVESTGRKVRKLAWNMLKYVNVCWKLKNGNVKKKMCNRGKWVKECETPIRAAMSVAGMDEFEIDMMVADAIESNSLVRTKVADKFTLENCLVEYEATPERIQAFKDYVWRQHMSIIAKSKQNDLEWQPVKIDKSNSFFCEFLCGHRRGCRYLDEYKTEKSMEATNNELTELF